MKVINYQYATVEIAGFRKSEFGWLLRFPDGKPAGIMELGVHSEARKTVYRLAKSVGCEEAVDYVFFPKPIKCKVKYLLDREYFKAVNLNVKNMVLAVDTISMGSLTSSIVHPRELFKAAIKRSAFSLVLVHNHPSGLPDPSTEDIEVTKRLVDAGKLLGIEVLDHVIIGHNPYVSLKERGVIG